MAFYDDYFFDSSYDTTRYCYARARLLREAEKSDAVIDAVMTALEVPTMRSCGRHRPSLELRRIGALSDRPD